MDDHGVKGHLAHVLQRGEDHAGNPETDDVIAGDQGVGGEEVGKVFRLLGPAQRGEGPQGRGEPGVQHVFILMQVSASALIAVGGVVHGDDHLAAVFAIPGRNAMAPPQLTGNAPVTGVAHPVHVGLAETIGQEAGFTLFHAFDGGLGQGFHLHEPLLGNHGFDDGVAAIAGAHFVLDGLDFFQQAKSRQVFHDGFAGIFGGHAGVLAAIQHMGFVDAGLAFGKEGIGSGFVFCAGHVAVVGEDTHDGQIVPLPHFVVVGVMGGGDLHHAGALFHIGMLVADNGDFLVDGHSAHPRD